MYLKIVFKIPARTNLLLIFKRNFQPHGTFDTKTNLNERFSYGSKGSGACSPLFENLLTECKNEEVR